jgi:phosphate transport system substrate-binding protein
MVFSPYKNNLRENNMPTYFLKFITSALLIIFPALAFSLDLNGAGRRIPAPIFALWGEHYSALRPGTTIKYQAVSATEGLKKITAGTVDFGESDTPLSKEDLAKFGLAQFPYMFSAITPIYNLPNVNGQLNLSGQVLGDIFLGNIKKWNDPAIAKLNSKLTLPNVAIQVVHLVPERGGTYNLSTYLTKVNVEWASKIGVGTTLKWPVGVAAENLYEMSAFVKKTPYTIGYSENAYARKNQLSLIRLQNQSGAFVSPHMGSIEEAVREIKWKAANNFDEDLINSSAPGAWPITSASYFLIKKTSDNIERRQALLSFIGWGMSHGDLDVTSLDFLPVPRSLISIIRNSWNDTPLVLEGAEVVNANQVKALLENGVPIIDARVETEYSTEHIKGAINVPYVEKSAKAANFNPQQDRFDLSKLPQNKKADIIFYCNAGACWKGYKASVVAIKAGYQKVYWFRGGIPEWGEKGLPTETALPAAAKK